MIVVTGASGFVGKHLINSIQSQYNVMGVFRTSNCLPDTIKTHFISRISSDTDWSEALTGAECVIHLAGIAHSKSSHFDDFENVNVGGSLKLAEDAYAAGVKRFIFISTVGVNGVSCSKPFRFNDNPHPTEEYAISKHRAEIGLKKIAEDSGMELVIIRPPLVYGKNAPGNFGTLLKLAKKNLPLPLGAINNQRSFVSVDNLIDLIITCIAHPNAANKTFLVSDDESISTSNLLKKLTLGAGKKPWLLPIPVCFLKFAASIVGKKLAVERFSNSLTVDIEHTKNTLSWKPPITLDEGIRRCFK